MVSASANFCLSRSTKSGFAFATNFSFANFASTDFLNPWSKKSVEAKLANEKFVANAKPDLVERERQKLADAETKIQSLQELLARLG